MYDQLGNLGLNNVLQNTMVVALKNGVLAVIVLRYLHVYSAFLSPMTHKFTYMYFASIT